MQVSDERLRNGLIVTCCIAGVLGIAASLKILSAVREYLYFAPTVFFLAKELGLAFVELALIAVLFRSWKQRETWMVVFLLFLAFTATHYWSLRRGEQTCDCFGLVSIAPIWLLAVDIFVAVVSLSFCLSIPKALRKEPPSRLAQLRGLTPAVSVASVGVVTFAILSWVLVSLRAEHRLIGHPLVTPSSLFSATSPFSDKRIRFARLPIRNISQKPVTIIGINETCSVRHGWELPVTIQPGEVLNLPLATKGAKPGRQLQAAQIYADTGMLIRSLEVWRVKY